MRSRSSQEQNHSAEPAEYQQQAHCGHPASGGIGQQFRQSEGEVRDREQGRPGVSVAASADQAAQRREQRQSSERAYQPRVSGQRPSEQTQDERYPKPNGQRTRGGFQTHARSSS